ncbi:MAG TPA: trypsin-like peptidase domain-containing protein [Nitrososphaerales archaeon]|nr:trypsin-like peptidase domain-containing protein [Nitrososphaerales archaeon]
MQRFSGAIEDVARSASPSVVSVGVDGRSGTGVVVDGEGHILTAGHVVSRLEQTEVGTSDGKKLVAQVVGRNPYADLALLKVEDAKLEPMELGDSSGLRVGQFVMALANPFSSAVSVTSGIVTGVNRPIGGWWRFSLQNAIVTDARLNPGYSGGPLVDASGRMVGMNVAYVSNRGIAVPANTIKKSIEKMAKGENVKRAYLGVVTNTIELPDEVAARSDVNQESALMVFSVEPESAAKRAGIRLGDVLLKLGDSPLTSVEDLTGALAEEAIGRKTSLLVMRGEELRELSVTPVAK